MAEPTGYTTYADIASDLATVFMDRIHATWNRACPEMAFIPAKRATAKNVSWVVKFPVGGTNVPAQGAAGGKFVDGAAVTAVRKEVRDPAVLNFANYHEAFGLTARGKAEAKVAGNPADLADLYGSEYKDAISRMAAILMTAFYAGDGATDDIKGMFGPALGQGAIDSTGAYAGIDPATSGREQWKSLVVDAQGDPPSFKLMRQTRLGPWNAMGENPDLWICSGAMFDAIAEKYDGNRRFLDSVTRMDGAKVKLDGGVEVLSWEGAHILRSPRYPDNTSMLALNTEYIHVEQLPDGPDGANPNAVSVPLQSMASAPNGATYWPLQALLVPLAIQGTAFNFDMWMFPQLVVPRRNAHARLINLADPTL